jgi:hypothetical protein
MDGDKPAESPLEAQVAALVRSVRRQTVALWLLVVVLVLAHGVPWLTYLFHSPGVSDFAGVEWSEDEIAGIEGEVPYDNEFHARPIEDKVERATAILRTRLDTSGERHREVVEEIIKQKPGIRLYYKVGDEFERLSHLATPGCEGCESDGRVVFMLGNPANMVYSATYRGNRVGILGDMPFEELRRLAAASLAAQGP